MAYVTGSSGSMTDLLTALRNACTSNGWTLSGSVLHKGNCYVEPQVVDGYLSICGGTGIDGSNALTGAGPDGGSCIGLAWEDDTFTWPATYAVHIGTAPDEVYLVVNYEVVRWQWIAFGCSPVAGLPGKGNWYGGSITPAHYLQVYITPSAGGAFNQFAQCMALFWNTNNVGQNCYLHHGLDGDAWSGADINDVTADRSAVAVLAVDPLLSRQPNTWNGEAALLPIQPHVARPSNKVSMVCDLGHSRYIRVDNYADGELITLGADRWKVYPWHKKNASERDGGQNVDHTGTLGWAIRYDGA